MVSGVGSSSGLGVAHLGVVVVMGYVGSEAVGAVLLTDGASPVSGELLGYQVLLGAFIQKECCRLASVELGA